MRYRIKRAVSWINPKTAYSPSGALSAGLLSQSGALEILYGTETSSQRRRERNSGGDLTNRLPGVTFLSSSDGGINVQDIRGDTSNRSRGTISNQFPDDQSDPSLNS